MGQARRHGASPRFSSKSGNHTKNGCWSTSGTASQPGQSRSMFQLPFRCNTYRSGCRSQAPETTPESHGRTPPSHTLGPTAISWMPFWFQVVLPTAFRHRSAGTVANHGPSMAAPTLPDRRDLIQVANWAGKKRNKNEGQMRHLRMLDPPKTGTGTGSQDPPHQRRRLRARQWLLLGSDISCRLHSVLWGWALSNLT